MMPSWIIHFAGWLFAAMILNTAAVVAGPDMGFDVTISLSDNAAAKLGANHETIIAFASYYGEPKKSAAKHVNEVGLISLSQRDEIVESTFTGRRVHISGLCCKLFVNG
ncbi:hypothetical protein LJR244_004400 [Brucella pseudogrignonensis]